MSWIQAAYLFLSLCHHSTCHNRQNVGDFCHCQAKGRSVLTLGSSGKDTQGMLLVPGQLVLPVSSPREARVSQGPVAGQGVRISPMGWIALSWPGPQLVAVGRPWLQSASKQNSRLFSCRSGVVPCTPIASFSLVNVASFSVLLE